MKKFFSLMVVASIFAATVGCSEEKKKEDPKKGATETKKDETKK
jgi:hypothetical protein